MDCNGIIIIIINVNIVSRGADSTPMVASKAIQF